MTQSFHWIFWNMQNEQRLAVSKFFVLLTALGSGSHGEKVMFVL